jgi:uncharacterized protein (UPF0335 family)
LRPRPPAIPRSSFACSPARIGCAYNASNQRTTGDQIDDEVTRPVNASTIFAAIASVPLKRRYGMTDTVALSGNRILSFIERIERIEEEIKELSEGKKEVFNEAKGDGFDVKILKEILRLRKQDQHERDEQESLLDLYLRAIQSAVPGEAKAA